MFRYFSIAAVILCESGRTHELPSADSTTDAVCMLQKVHLETSANAFPSDDQSKNLTSYEADYVYDSPEGDTRAPLEVKMTPEALFRLVVTSIVSLLIVLVGVLACLLTEGDGNQKPMAFHVSAHAAASLCALLILKAIKSAVGHIFYRVASLSPHFIGFDFAVLVVIFLVVSSWLFMYQNSQAVHDMVGTIGMYVLGFAWIDTYQMVRTAKLDGITLPILVIALLALLLLSLTSTTTRSVLKDSSLAVTSEERFVALAIGYLLSQLIEFGIASSHVTVFHKHVWLNCAIVCLVGTSLYVATLTDNCTVSERIQRMNVFAYQMCLMSATWCFLDAITWQLSNDSVGKSLALMPSSKGAAFLAALIVSLVIAVAFTALCIYSLVKFSADWNNPRIAHVSVLVSTMGFAVGCSWANYVIQVIHAGSIQSQVIAPDIYTASMCSFLCAIMIPVWHYYIKPYDALRSCVG